MQQLKNKGSSEKINISRKMLGEMWRAWNDVLGALPKRESLQR